MRGDLLAGLFSLDISVPIPAILHEAKRMDPHHLRDNRELTEAGDIHAHWPKQRLGLRTRATVERVIDGDTLDVSLHWPVRIRLIDCWAPERDTDPGKAATDQLNRLATPGSQVVIDIDTSDSSRLGDVLTFGRVLADVYRINDEESISELMIRFGHATRSKRRG